MKKRYDFSKARPNPHAKRLKKATTVGLDQEQLVITPTHTNKARAQKLAAVQAQVVRKHKRTFRKLAK